MIVLGIAAIHSLPQILPTLWKTFKPHLHITTKSSTLAEASLASAHKAGRSGACRTSRVMHSSTAFAFGNCQFQDPP